MMGSSLISAEERHRPIKKRLSIYAVNTHKFYTRENFNTFRPPIAHGAEQSFEFLMSAHATLVRDSHLPHQRSTVQHCRGVK